MRVHIPILLSAVLMVLPGCGSGRWTEVKPDGEGFVVSMPAKPTQKQIERDLPLGQIKAVGFALTTNQMTFTLHYVDYPDVMVSGKSADAVLDAGLDKMLSAYPHARKQSARILLQGFPARSFTIEDPDTSYTAIGRLCLVGRRTYVLQAVMPSMLSGRPEVNRFIGSFRVKPEPRR